MHFTIAIEDPRQEDMESLIAELNQFLLALSPPGSCFLMSVDDMVDTEMTVYIARDERGKAMACGALRRLPAQWSAEPGGQVRELWGEVKRMYTRPEARGHGIGSAILASIEKEARQHGLARLVLETGIAKTHQGAHSTYKKAGFEYRGSFGDYPKSEWNEYMEKVLDLAAQKPQEEGLPEHEPPALGPLERLPQEQGPAKG